ncbi:hypothetical protein FAES_1846 [Fibrella aestuarina BUZ 2]|uniref:Uncharacterized protein n=1 Tax=Fibrella aestuarina BUZ 2 TaxID=1166018 RepID=I0K6V3_9BACT|nr:hypothetical protein [Fibrella aestuarina]CCG99856.1 hypothetical protein FAES_1846 [Fibrella aestuarina BUZ 2]
MTNRYENETPEQRAERLKRLETKTRQLESGTHGLDKNLNIVSLADNPNAIVVPTFGRSKR